MIHQMFFNTFLFLGLNMIIAVGVAASEPPSITSLVFRDRMVTISSGEEGLRYSIFSLEGTPLQANLTEAELSAQYPTLYEQVRGGFAHPNSTSDIIPWAGMFRDHLPID